MTMANPAKTSCAIVGIGNDYPDPVSNQLPVATSAAGAIGGRSQRHGIRGSSR
jgi:hypothetical protein